MSHRMRAAVELPARPARPKAKTGAPDQSWFRISNHATGAPKVYIYEEIGYWGVTAGDFIVALAEIDGDFDLHINSPGGDVFDGLAIYNTLLGHPGKVTGHVDGLAASAASFIAMACDELEFAKTGQMMIHDASGLAWGNAAEMLAMASLLDKASDNIASIYADRAGGSVESWRELMRAETWYTGSEAVAAKLGDRLAPTKRDKAADEPADMQDVARWDLSMYRYQGRAAAPDPSSPAPEPAALPVPVFAWTERHTRELRAAFERAMV